MSRLCVVFDLDDTLYPERSFAISAFGEAAAWAQDKHGIDGLDVEMTRLLDDGHLGTLFPLALERRGIDRAHASDLIGLYRAHQPAALALYEDVLPALARFEAMGPIGLITDGTVSVQQAKVRALGLQKRFGEIVYTHALGGRDFAKPHPASYEAMVQAVGGPGDRFVYVGDNPAKDFISPNRMGWTTVQIVRPQRIHSTAEAISGGSAHHVIETLAELPKLLGAD
jgi:putative hydrolase of the HAD superfamily